MRSILLTLLVVFGGASALAEESKIDIREWEVPWADTRPRDPYAESATSVWFVGQRGGYLAHLDVATAEMKRVELPEGERPHNLIVDDEGIVWYAGNTTGVIGRYDPQSGEIEEIAMPDPAARDPHTLIAAEDGAIWFTVQGGNFLGRLDPQTRKVDLIASKTERSRPYGIKVASDGTVWAVLFGTNKLARIDPETLELTEIDLPRQEARPRRLEVGEDGRIWYGDYAGGVLGVYDPSTEEFAEWDLPSGESARPYGTAMDSQGRVWVFETGVQPNRLVGFDPQTSEFFAAADVPSGGGTVRHTHYHAPSGAIWFGTDTNYIGRALVEPAKAAE